VQNSSAYLKGFTDQFPTFAEQEKNWPEFNARARQEMYRNITLDAKGNSRQLPEATVNALMAQFDKNMEAVGEAYGPNGRGGLVIKQSNRLAAELKINTLTDFPTLAAINAAVPGIFQSGAGASLVDAIFAAKLGGNAQNATPLQEQVKAEVSTIAAGGVSLPRGGVKSREETTYEALDGINFAVKGVLPPTPLSKKTATITAAGVVVEATKPGSPVQADIDYNPDTYGNCVWTIGNEIQNCSPPDRQVIYQSLASDTFATNFQRLSPEVKAKAAPRAQKVLALYVAETENRWNGLVYKNGKITIEGAASAQQLIEVNSANKALQQLILTHKVTDPDMTPDEILQKYFKHEAVTDAGD
jgi:hypothetical protein